MRKALIRKQLLQTIRAVTGNPKTGKRRKTGGIILMAFLFVMVWVSMVMAFFGMTEAFAACQRGGAAALNEKENEELRKSLKAVRAVPEFNTAMMELEAGSCEAVVIDQGVAEMHLKEKAGKFAILAEALKAEQYGVGFKLGDTELRDAVQITLKEMAKDGTAAKISAKWFDGKNVFVMLP